MFLHLVAGHLVADFETSDKTSCLAPHDANPFHAVRGMKGGLMVTFKTILLGLARCCGLEFYCNEVYYCTPPINVKKHRKTRRRFVNGCYFDMWK